MSTYAQRGKKTADGRPVVLLLASTAWISTARLAMALDSRGCRVELVASRRHPAMATRAVRKRHGYDPLRPLESLRCAILAAGAASVIAVDELMVLHLEELLAAEVEGSALASLLEKSLGGLGVMAAAGSRMRLMDVARGAGVAVPETVVVREAAELRGAMAAVGSPMVLKSDATSGGRGVRVVSDLQNVAETWRTLAGPPGLARAVKRGVMQREWTHLRPWARQETRGVTAQRFVQGTERTAMAVCRDGVVVACVCLEVVKTWCVRGPSSVLRVVDDAAMEESVARVAGALGVSGFCGFDFIVERGEALLIEMNARPTQLVHLPLGVGRDLVAAYVREVVGVSVGDRSAATDGELVALFPQELQRDAESEMLALAHHDVPWGEPRLMRVALGKMQWGVEAVVGPVRGVGGRLRMAQS